MRPTHDFTVWLQENPDVLSDILNFELASIEREQAAGTFSVDLVGEDGNGDIVVIENQLEKSDHDHLGKLITYVTALEARRAVWIVSTPRPEHVKAIAWLNEESSVSFYLLQIEAVRIGDSPPAPLLTRIVGPSEEARAAGEARQHLNERQSKRHEFFTKLLDHSKTKSTLHASISPSSQNWVWAMRDGWAWSYVVLKHSTRVELYVDRGDADVNGAAFEVLESHRPDIEAAFGSALNWQPLHEKRACRISFSSDLGGLDDEEQWEAIISATVDAMQRLESAISPYLPRALAAAEHAAERAAVSGSAGDESSSTEL